MTFYLQGGGWVHSVNFSPDGNRLAWVGHDSSISVADATKGMAIYKCKTVHLPLLSCVWISPNSIVAGGHDCTPLVFQIDSAGQVNSLFLFLRHILLTSSFAYAWGT